MVIVFAFLLVNAFTISTFFDWWSRAFWLLRGFDSSLWEDRRRCKQRAVYDRSGPKRLRERERERVEKDEERRSMGFTM